MKKLSICISTYEMRGKGVEYLAFSFDKLIAQTFTDFDVVISDQSRNNAIEKVCKDYSNKLDIHYFKEKPEATPSDNTNNAIKRATGQLIKILFLDDFLYHEKTLEHIVNNFDLKKDSWLITACICTKDGKQFFKEFHPTFDGEKILTKNTVSAPSVVTVKNDDPVLFDTKLVWWQDLDYYRRSYERFGNPKIVDSVDVAIRVGDHQMGNSSKEQVREDEFRYILKKHAVPHAIAKVTKYKLLRHRRELKRHILQITPEKILTLYRISKKHVRETVTTAIYKIRFFPISIRWNTSDASVAKQVFIDKQYDLNYQKIDANIIVDAGANVGYTSVFFAKKFPRAKIFAIEPEESNFNILKKNTSSYPSISALKKGLWHRKTRLKIIDQHQGNWAFKTEESSNPESSDSDVETITIEDILTITNKKRINILKLDIEGAEKELFSENYSWLDQVDMIIIELHERMKQGCKDSFFTAIKKYDFEQSTYGELIILKRKSL